MSDTLGVLKWAKSADKHHVDRWRSRYVIEHARLILIQRATPPARPDDQLLFLGDDPDGVPLEVIGVEGSTGGVLVIHAMRMRKKYVEQYEEAKRWRG